MSPSIPPDLRRGVDGATSATRSDIDLLGRGARVRLGGAHDPRQVVGLDDVGVDDGDAPDAEVGELLNEDRASSARADDADVQRAEPGLALGAEQPDLAVEALVGLARRAQPPRSGSRSIIRPDDADLV